MSFTGFTHDGLDLLKRLPELDRDGFQAAADTYRSGIVEPSKALVDALGPELRVHISEGIQFGARTNQSIAPINNDRRFNPSASPYKDHLLLRFWEGPNNRSGSVLFVRITPDELGFAVGMSFTAQQLAAYRERVETDGDRLAAALKWLVRHRGADVVGSALKRVPAPYADDHPHADLLRRKSLQVRWRVDPGDAITGRRLMTLSRDQLRRGAGVHQWLVEHLT
jgi:uncharacterized protein (TIGR02453 family)